MLLPKSVSSIYVNVAGLACFLLALLLCVNYQVTDFWSVNETLLILSLSLFLPIVLLELVFRPQTVLPLLSVKHSVNVKRVLTKLLSLYVIWALIAFIYWVFPEYRKGFYQPAWSLLYGVFPWVAAFSLPYFWLVDKRMSQPEDGYFSLGSWILRKLTRTKEVNFDDKVIIQLFLGWLVKLFFLPLMIVFFHGNIHALITQHNSWAVITQDFQHLYDFLYLLLFTIDLVFAVVGYSVTLRLLDTHIRSTEPTMLGWFSALICYPPFLGGVSALFFAYNMDGYTWGGWLEGNEAAYVLWGSAILLCIAIYCFATVMFGIRFSNLTHRGIITNGPYRYSKHPAYLAKNLSWWLITIPFISQANNIEEVVRSCAMLLLMNLVYYIRAKTEEKHLSQDVVYREYSDWIGQNGVIAKIRHRYKAILQ